jgi:hypothetical protein
MTICVFYQSPWTICIVRVAEEHRCLLRRHFEYMSPGYCIATTAASLVISNYGLQIANGWLVGIGLEEEGCVMISVSQFMRHEGALVRDDRVVHRGAGRILARLLARLRAAIAAEAPVGYEDDTGFHYGVRHR